MSEVIFSPKAKADLSDIWTTLTLNGVLIRQKSMCVIFGMSCKSRHKISLNQ